MTTGFNPADFDWGDSAPGIRTDSVQQHVDDLLHEAVNNRFGRKRYAYLARKDVSQSAGRRVDVKYYVPDEGKKMLEKWWPGYTFVYDRALQHHDHPVAHMNTVLGEEAMIDTFGGQFYVDLFGNVARNRANNRRCHTVYSFSSPKDYLRHINVEGPDTSVYDYNAFMSGGRFGRVKNIAVTHALYYINVADLCNIVNACKGRVVKALIHRHKNTHGFLNGGEQEYWVTPEGDVVQENVATGERYKHRTLENLFQHQTARMPSGQGMTWTITASGPDAYIVTFAAAPGEICEEWKSFRAASSTESQTYSSVGITVKTMWGWTWLWSSAPEKRLLANTEFFDCLRRYVAGRARTPRLRLELFTYARRISNKNDIMAHHGGGHYDVPLAVLPEYVVAAFYIDVRSEVNLALSYHKANHQDVKILNAYYDNMEVPIDATPLAGVAKMFKGAAQALSQREDLERAFTIAHCGFDPYDVPSYDEPAGPDINPTLPPESIIAQDRSAGLW